MATSTTLTTRTASTAFSSSLSIIPPSMSQNKSYPCTCPPNTPPGTTLLFYRYFSLPPYLPNPPPSLSPSSSDSLPPATNTLPSLLAAFHTSLCTRLNLSGKLRLSTEGFNITVAGTSTSIARYIEECVAHWSFAGLALEDEEARNAFFKPSNGGCKCVFPEGLKVRVCEEICPMGVVGFVPRDSEGNDEEMETTTTRRRRMRIRVKAVEAPEWHRLLTSQGAGVANGNAEGETERVVLLDVRNHYESSLGHFTDSSGVSAIRPGLRRFSQFPLYVRRGRLRERLFPACTKATIVDAELNKEKENYENISDAAMDNSKTKILSYCTGGIRCEKATRFLAENIESSSTQSEQIEILTLRGGIHAYLCWIKDEIHEGRMQAEDSLFKGRNYVFDGRGSIGLEDWDGKVKEVGKEEEVGHCHVCMRPAGRLAMCKSQGCRLELLVCRKCWDEGVNCCEDCEGIDEEEKVKTSLEKKDRKGRRICRCEREREATLWGTDVASNERRTNRNKEADCRSQTQGKRTQERRDWISLNSKDRVDIQVQLVQPKEV